MNPSEIQTQIPAFSPELILYKDELILIANKPAGIPIHETKDQQRADFTRLLQNSLGLPYLRTANRLDLYTTGIVVFGLDPHSNSKVDALLKESRKFYLALVYGIISEDEFHIESFLKDGNKKVQTVRSGGKKAITLCKVLGRDSMNNLSLVEAELVTGRRHQIRIHLSEYGNPIVGDRVYAEKMINQGLKRIHWNNTLGKAETQLSNKDKNQFAEALYLHSYKLDLSSYKSDLVVRCQPYWMIY